MVTQVEAPQVGATDEDALTPEELAQRCGERMMAQDQASARLGIRLLDAGPGTAVVEMVLREDMINGWGTCHGGVIASLADTAFAVACASHGEVTVAAGFDISFIAPGYEGDLLVATAAERSLRRRNGIYDVTVTRGHGGETVAEFRGRSRSIGRRVLG